MHAREFPGRCAHRRRRRPFVVHLIALLTVAFATTPRVVAQTKPPSDRLSIHADQANTWSNGDVNVIQLSGNVSIQTDDAHMTARQAVVWLAPVSGAIRGRTRLAQFQLIGDARLEHEGSVRSGPTLFVDEEVRDDRVELNAAERSAEEANDSELYTQALTLRFQAMGGPPPATQPITDRMLLTAPGSAPEFIAPSTTQPATQPTTQPSPISFEAMSVEPVTSNEGKLAYVLSGNVLLTQLKRGPDGFQLELRADRAVIFTQIASLRELQVAGSRFRNIQDAVYAAYLEGDVRVVRVPNEAKRPESRLDARRVYYDFITDRAILTNAVLHSFEPDVKLPLIMRADTIRQLSQGEYRADHAELTTSSFELPSYSIRTSEAYVRVSPTNIPEVGNRTEFVAHNAVLNVFHIPLFYLPVMAGSMTERGGAVRGVQLGNSKNNGFGIRTELGLLETLGKIPNEDFDAGYRLDYFTERGFAAGLNGKYHGGFITETTRQPWDFQGQFRSYFLPDDTGVDKLGRDRRRVQADGFRGHVLFEHQHFFPDDWQVQLRYGWVSDPTFLEYWEPGNFDTGPPHDFSAYVKHQNDTEAYSLVYQFQPNNLVTTANELQESFPQVGPGVSVSQSKPVTVERLPELSYWRIGDSVGDADRLTFFSQNTMSVLRFNQSGNSLFDYGFVDAKKGNPAILPGLPSIGTTGITNQRIYRGDFRQELDLPTNAGPFKVMPYVMGRLTSYSDSPEQSSVNRLFAGAGVRVTTSFWKVDDTAENDFLDIHRIRHVIEPELNLFTSAATYDRNDVFVFDEPIDSIYDVSAVSIALRQRWQTKRGGPGNWRSSDFLSLNVEANFFANAPDGSELPPEMFRGLYFPSLPEASVPRDSINADALYRISDTTVVLSDMQYNLKEQALATTSVGLAVQRDVHTSYFLGVRYLGEVNDTVASVATSYQLSTKYSFAIVENYSIASRRSQNAQFNITRKFDRFFMTFGLYWDQVKDETGFRFGLFPEGLGYGLSTDQLNTVFGQ